MPDDLPIAKPVSASKAPPAGRKFPCPSCAAKLDFDPAARGLKCPYCGFEQKIEKGDPDTIRELDYQDYLTREEGKGKALPGRSSEVKCPGCGAVVVLDDKVATEKCPFCTTFLDNVEKQSSTMIPPEGVLPFHVDLRGAREAFEQWLHGLWFAPTELKKLANLGQLSGVYLPYWTYDAMTYTFYEGMRGENYTETEWYTETTADGKSEQKSRTVVKIRWWPASGEVRHFFDDVLVCGSKSLPNDLIDDLGDWRLDKIEPFDQAYLSGFRTENYAVGLKEGFKTAKGLMASTIDSLIRQDIGGDHQQISSKQSRYSAVTFKHILLPVWVAVYRYRETTYQLLVNARTGKVTGYRPWSTMKIVRLVVLILLAIGLIVGVFVAFGN